MNGNKTPDITKDLRAILLARAAGTLSREEFERRQATLHAVLLDPGYAGGGRRRFSKWWIALPVALVVLAAGGFLAWRAIPGTAAGGSAGEAAAPAERAQPDAAALNQRLASLSGEVVKNPLNGETWAELGRVYAALGRHAEAVDAFAKAAAILPADAQLFADWADSYVVTHNRQWDATSRDFIKRALAADAKNLKTLSLAASDAYDQGDFKTAIAYWKRMQTAAPGDASVKQYVDANIADATAAMGGKPGNVAVAAAAPAASAISGRVSIAGGLRASVSPGDAVFVFARSVEGQGPPLAAKRYTVADLPVDFRLDDESAMVPGRSLSTAANVVVVARVSKSGSPVAQPGDLESAPLQLAVGTTGVKLEIGSVH